MWHLRKDLILGISISTNSTNVLEGPSGKKRYVNANICRAHGLNISQRKHQAFSGMIWLLKAQICESLRWAGYGTSRRWSPKPLKLGLTRHSSSLTGSLFLHLVLMARNLENPWFIVKRSMGSWALRMYWTLSYAVGTARTPFYRGAHGGSECGGGVVRTQYCLSAFLRESKSRAGSLWACSWGHTWI